MIKSNSTPPRRHLPDLQLPPGPLHEEAFRALIRVSGLLRWITEPRMASLGLSGAQWGVLRSLRRIELAGEPPPRSAELGSMLLVHPPSLSTTLDRMQRSGLILRLTDERDRRARRVQLTPAGRDLLERGLEGHSDWIAGIMSGLSAAQQAQLKALLLRMGAHLALLAESPSPAAPASRPRKSAAAPSAPRRRRNPR